MSACGAGEPRTALCVVFAKRERKRCAVSGGVGAEPESISLAVTSGLP
jgi:hypothetical protein